MCYCCRPLAVCLLLLELRLLPSLGLREDQLLAQTCCSFRCSLQVGTVLKQLAEVRVISCAHSRL